MDVTTMRERQLQVKLTYNCGPIQVRRSSESQCECTRKSSVDGWLKASPFVSYFNSTGLRVEGGHVCAPLTLEGSDNDKV